MRDPNPVSGVPDSDRYRGDGHRKTPDRYAPQRGRDGAGTYEFHATTLEEEAKFRGWIPAARPSGDAPLQGLYTIGMRGEPGYDDDNNPNALGYGDGDSAPDQSSYD